MNAIVAAALEVVKYSVTSSDLEKLSKEDFQELDRQTRNIRQYNYSGELPAKANIRLNVGAAQAGKTLYYYLLIVKAMFLNKSEQPVERIATDFPARLSLVVCLIMIVFAGLLSTIYQHISALSFI